MVNHPSLSTGPGVHYYLIIFLLLLFACPHTDPQMNLISIAEDHAAISGAIPHPFQPANHCALCGCIFCDGCSSFWVLLPHLGLYDKQRACKVFPPRRCWASGSGWACQLPYRQLLCPSVVVGFPPSVKLGAYNSCGPPVSGSVHIKPATIPQAGGNIRLDRQFLIHFVIHWAELFPSSELYPPIPSRA